MVVAKLWAKMGFWKSDNGFPSKKCSWNNVFFSPESGVKGRPGNNGSFWHYKCQKGFQFAEINGG
jgi:hypothetical protein